VAALGPDGEPVGHGLPRRAGVRQRQRGVEDEPPRDGGHQKRLRLHEDGNGAALRGPLQAVPGGGRGPAQDALRAAAQVEDDHGVVAVAHEDVRGREGLLGRAAAHPHEVAQHVLRDGPGAKPSEPSTSAIRCRAAWVAASSPASTVWPPPLGAGRDELRQAPRGQPAPEGIINRADRRGTLPHGLRAFSGKRAARSDRSAETVWEGPDTCAHHLQAGVATPRRISPTSTPCDSRRRSGTMSR
jgi:hypothetical protein